MSVTNNRAFVDAMRRLFAPGMRIKLMLMKDPSGVPEGTIGTVDFVDDAGQIQMSWDNGSSLALIYGEDVFQIIPDECGTKFVIKGVVNKKTLYFKKLTTDFLWGTTWDIPNCSEQIADATLFNTIEEAEEICQTIDSRNFKIFPVCPRCHNEYQGCSAISRTDNKTEICEKCGLSEALWEFFEYEKKAKNSDPLYQFSKNIFKEKETTN